MSNPEGLHTGLSMRCAVIGMRSLQYMPASLDSIHPALLARKCGGQRVAENKVLGE